MTEPIRVRGTQIPDGARIATMVGTESQCSVKTCDSWLTVAFEVEAITDDGIVIIRYPICLKHVGKFIREMFFEAEGILEPGGDCGDPDCPVHGDSSESDTPNYPNDNDPED